MTPVIAPLLLGNTGSDVLNLQRALLELYRRGYIQNQEPALSDFTVEASRAFFGGATNAFVEAFCQSRGLSYSAESPVTKAVADAMNALLEGFEESQPYAVTVLLTVPSGNARNADATVRLYKILSMNAAAAGSRVLLDSRTIGPSEPPVRFELNRDQVFSDQGMYGIQATVECDGTTSTSAIGYPETSALQLEVVLDERISVQTEFDLLYSALVGGHIIGDAEHRSEDDAQLLAKRTGEPETNVRLFLRALNVHKTSSPNNEDGPGAAFWYGLFRQNIAAEPGALMHAPPTVLVRALQTAAASGVIAPEDPAVFLAKAQQVPAALVRQLAGAAVDQNAMLRIIRDAVNGDDALAAQFYTAHYAYFHATAAAKGGELDGETTPPAAPGDFWTEVLPAQVPAIEPYIRALQAAFQLVLLVGTNPALIRHLLPILAAGAGAGPLDPAPLAGWTAADWRSAIGTVHLEADFLVPDFVPEDADRIAAYADRILSNFKGAFPTNALASGLASDSGAQGGAHPFHNLWAGLDDFLANNPAFDIRTASVDALLDGEGFDFTNVLDIPAFVDEIGTVQRRMNLTVDYKAIAAMAKSGYVSSLHVVQASAQDFAQNIQNAVDAADAAVLYDTAEATTLYNTVMAMEYFQRLSDNDSFVFGAQEGGSSSSGAQNFAMLRTGDSAHAEWRSLFGSLDSCSCSSCMSVYSPSAYLVDLLRFLRGDSAAGSTLSLHDRLLGTDTQPGRRRDIRDLRLTCKNTNTPVPYIDLVNELLEDLVESGSFNYLAARQTEADAARQRAIPEYTKTDAPYQKLRQAIYPWALPYNFYKRQIDTHLGVAGIKPHELLQRMSDGTAAWDDDPMAVWTHADFCAQYIGISNTERDLITNAALGDPNSNYADLWPYYGFKANGNNPALLPVPNPADTSLTLALNKATWVSELAGRVDLFLQQTGLTYKELLQLCDCYYVNPFVPQNTAARTVEIKAQDGKPVDTCDLSLLQLDGMTGAVLGRLYRFVKLKRALGCTYYELDHVLMDVLPRTQNNTSFLPVLLNLDTFKQTVQVKRLAEQLNCKMSDLVLFKDFGPSNPTYGKLSFRPYRDYEKAEPEPMLHQYDALFRNPLLPSIDTDHYPFDIGMYGSYYATGVDSVLQDEKALHTHLAGALGLPALEVDALIQQDPAPLATIAQGLTAPGKVSVSVPWLARLYGRSVFIKGLGLTAAEWNAYQTWLAQSGTFDGSNGFSNPAPTNSPYAALRFVGYVKMMQEAGISIADVEYLLRDNVLDAVGDANRNDHLTTVLAGLRDGLLQKWHPVYAVSTDGDGKKLETILHTILDGEKAARLTTLLAASTPATYTAAEQGFLSTDLAFFLPQSVGNGLAVLSAEHRRTAVYDAFVAYQIANVYTPFVNTYLAKELKLNAEMVALLLEQALRRTVSNQVLNGYTDLLAPDFVTDPQPLPGRWGATTAVAAAFRTVLQLDKAALLITRFKLDLSDADYLWNQRVLAFIPQPADFPVRTTPTGAAAAITPFARLAEFVRWMRVRAFLGDDTVLLYKLVLSMTPPPAGTGWTPRLKTDVLKDVGVAFKMPAADVLYLLGGVVPVFQAAGRLQVPYPSDYWRQPGLYQRLIDCLELQSLLPASMQTLGTVADAVRTAEKQDDANAVIQLVRAPYDDAQWMKTVRPINDLLRAERRDALVAYLLANPPAEYPTQWRTDNDLYETLLIDVEMMPCMSTTRILQAINTVQLWIDRIALRLEKDASVTLTMNTRQQRQWQTWRKLYRVWEANRKVFLYPENWIEPELRDGKTPAFQELEKYFRQNEVTPENVEEAYRTYLDRLNEVAHLDIVGIYRETTQPSYSTFNPVNTDVLHVFGRTPASPHIYYYRKRVSGEWTPWEKMDVQIASDHVLPVMWRGRLRFYWLNFMKDQVAGSLSAVRSRDQAYVTPDPSRWKIDLAWTEYQHGVWSAAQIGKESLYSTYMVEEEPFSRDHVAYYSYAHEDVNRNWNFKGALDYQRQFSINWYAKIDLEGNLQFMLTERTWVLPGATLNHYVHSPTNNPFVGQTVPRIVETLKRDDSYWSHHVVDMGFFTAKFNGIIATPLPFPNTVERNLYCSATNQDLVNSGYGIVATDYEYRKATGQGYAHRPDSSVQLLNRAPGTDIGKVRNKYLVFPRQVPQGYLADDQLLIPFFFYKDADNAFFVERTGTTYQTVERNPIYAYIKEVEMSPRFSVYDPNAVQVVSGNNVPGLYPNEDDPGHRVKFIPRTVSIEIGQYRFHNYRHIRVDAFLKRLYEQGVDGLLNRAFVSSMTDSMGFGTQYSPTPSVVQPYPNNGVDFAWDSAFATYNWELFYHIPVFIANKLSQNQQFEEARKWYHYVFNPTVDQNSNQASFWNFTEFYNTASANNLPTPLQVMQDQNLQLAVDRWADNPFKPHLVARTRVSAYMKNTVMKYLDNLIAWGDDLFRSDTREAINEATLLYVLAAQLLGRRPETVPARAEPPVHTYATLSTTGTWNAFGNAVVKIENILMASGATILYNPATGTTSYPSLKGSMYYFCLPPNDKLKAYWDLLADRFFKIRNCRTIDGVTRELALFDPPIDPALLVKAAAAGLSLSDVLADLNAPLPLYRFNTLAQKASELAGEVKSLGGQLLSALEKRDAETLALLRSSQEQIVLQAATEVREKGIEEAARQIESLQVQQKNTTQRRDHYKSLINTGLNGFEQQQLDSLSESIPLTIAQGVTQTLASAMFALPEVHLGPFLLGVRAGGQNIGNLINAASGALGTVASVNNIRGSMAATKGGFARRREDWELQVTTSETELQQLDRQIVAAQIRKAMAEVELRNHRLQLQNAVAMHEAMQEKFTNEDLYEWMISQLSLTYFEVYKLAYDVAKRAERCYRFELGLATSDFVQPGYWSNLKKGLLAGEQLHHDIRRMEVAYLEQNKRHLELTKHVSLATFAPEALAALRAGVSDGCTVQLPEWLFDMDYPGQHLRRIKSVSVSIPCVAGPYTTISCKLSLIKSKYRVDATTGGSNSTGNDYKEDSSGNDTRFTYQFGNIQSIATSSAQNDSGLFEFNFRDERYLPFEGAGAVSEWKIELPAAYAQFDYSTISDLILHVKYTALDGGGLRTGAKGAVAQVFNDATAGKGLKRIFSLRQEFSNEWQAYTAGYAGGTKTAALRLQLTPALFPFYMQQAQTISIRTWTLFLKPKGTWGPEPLTVELLNAEGNAIGSVPISNTEGAFRYGALTLDVPANGSVVQLRLKQGGQFKDPSALLEDALLLVDYDAGSPASYPQTVTAWYNLPSGLTSSMLAWWSADNPQNVVSGTKLVEWRDQSGHSNHVLAPTSVNRPSIQQDWHGSGKPALVFEGAQALRKESLTLPGGTQNFTVFMVGEKLSTDNANVLEFTNDYNAQTGWVFYVNDGGGRDVFGVHSSVGYSLCAMSQTVTANVKGLYVFGAALSDSSHEATIELNDVVYDSYLADMDNTGAFSSSSFNIGARAGSQYPAHFAYAELILFPSKLAAPQIAMVKSYLKTKYGF